MAIPRASAAPAVLGRTVFRRAATQTRNQAWRQIGRRHYASGHGGQKSSELPWIIGSVGFTVPAAVWLFGQGPKGAPHAPEGDEERDEEAKDKEDTDGEAPEAKTGEAAPNEGGAQDQEQEKESTEERQPKQEGGQDKDDSDSDKSKDESSDEKSEDSGDDSKQESKDKGKDEAKDDSDSPNAPGQINHKSDSGKGPGEGQKGSRAPTERKGEKDSRHDDSGAQNPYITQNKEEKSKKGQGITDTAKIHGTVDTSRPTR